MKKYFTNKIKQLLNNIKISNCEHGFDITEVANTKIDPICKKGCGKKLSELTQTQ